MPNDGSSAERGVSMRPSENALVRVRESAQRVSAKRESYRESAKRESYRESAKRESVKRRAFPEDSSDSEQNEEETCPRVYISYRIPYLKRVVDDD
jgi:hypothetical protein